VLVTHYYAAHGGGVEIVAGQLATRLSAEFEMRWHAAAPTEKPAPHGVIVRPMRAWNGLERRFGLPIPVPSPAALLGIVRAVRAADIVWVHDLIYPANLVAAIAAIRTRTPLVVTVHVGAIPYRSRLVRRLMAAAVALTGRLLLTRAAAVAFVSERVRAEFVARWRLRDERLIPNGVDFETFAPPAEGGKDRVRTALGVGDRPAVLFVGRFVERKGLPLLRELAGRLPSTCWLLAGRGQIDPSAWGLPNVQVERDRSGRTLAELYGAVDLLALPSIGEGFPLVVAEALATGLPVLVDPSTIAGYPAVAAVAHGESATGPNAAARWSTRIAEILADDAGRAEMAPVRVAFAREHWDWERCAATYAGLFEAVLDPAVSGSGSRNPDRPTGQGRA
jgi:glycosyltransferase involved in cell wall biosynthesis